MTCRPCGRAASLALGGACLFVLLIAGCGSQPVGATAETRTAGTSGDTKSPANSPADAKPKLLPGAKTKVLDKAGDKPYDKTFDDVRFDIKPGDPFKRDMLPEAIESLDGKRIRIRGYMLPTAQNRGIKSFVLVRDNQECCFGPGAALYDCMLVELTGGKSTTYSFKPVAVEGTFSIREIVVDGMHLAIYRIDADSVR